MLLLLFPCDRDFLGQASADAFPSPACGVVDGAVVRWVQRALGRNGADGCSVVDGWLFSRLFI